MLEDYLVGGYPTIVILIRIATKIITQRRVFWIFPSKSCNYCSTICWEYKAFNWNVSAQTIEEHLPFSVSGCVSGVCVFLFMYAWVCVGYVHSHMHIHLKGRGQHWLIFSVALLYIFWERISQWKHSFETRPLWLASKLQGLSYFSLPGTEVTGVYRSTHILSSISGFQPWTPCLFSCRSSNWDIYPSLRIFSFKVTFSH